MQRLRAAASAAFALVLAACALLPLAAADGEGDGTDPAPPGVGHFTLNATTSQVIGSYVKFRAPETEAVLADFEAHGIPYFHVISVTGYERGEFDAHGSVFTANGRSASVQVNDNPGAVIKLNLLANTTATFSLAAGVHAGAPQNSQLNLTVEGSNRSASAWATCDEHALELSADGASITVSAGSGSCKAYFRVGEDAPAGQGTTEEGAISTAAESGRLAAEVYVARDPQGGEDVTTYGDAVAVISHTPGRLVVAVDAGNRGPISLLVRFLPGSNGVDVTVDGKPAVQSSGLEDSLNPQDDLVPEYNLTQTPGSSLLAISLPQPGSHLIEIQDLVVAPARDLSPSYVGVGIALAVVAAAAVLLFRRR